MPRVVKTSGSPPNLEINEPVSISAADTSGVMRFDGLHYIDNLSGKALPDPSASYRLEITLPNGHVVTAPFRAPPLVAPAAKGRGRGMPAGTGE